MICRRLQKLWDLTHRRTNFLTLIEIQQSFTTPVLGSSKLFKHLNMAGTPAHDIAPGRLAATRSLSVSTSPTATFHSPNFGSGQLTRTLSHVKQLKPFDKTDMRILLLENVNQSGKDLLLDQGYQLESLKTSLSEDQLIEKIK